MGEVEDAHQPVDEREARGDQEVEGAEPEASDREQDEGAHCAPPATPSSARTRSGSASRSWPARCARRAPGRARRVAREPLRRRPGSARPAGSSRLARPREHLRDLGDEQRRQALGRLVDQEHAVLVQERPRDRDHLLLAARERPGALPAALLELREQLVDEVIARRRRSARPGAGSLPPSGRRRPRGPRARSRRRGGRSVRGEPVRSAPASVPGRAAGRAPAGRASSSSCRRRCGPAGGDAALRDTERHALEDVRLPEVDVQVLDRRGITGLPEVRVLDRLVADDGLGRVDGEQAPWCMTAIRSASP